MMANPEEEEEVAATAVLFDEELDGLAVLLVVLLLLRALLLDGGADTGVAPVLVGAVLLVEAAAEDDVDLAGADVDGWVVAVEVGFGDAEVLVEEDGWEAAGELLELVEEAPVDFVAVASGALLSRCVVSNVRWCLAGISYLYNLNIILILAILSSDQSRISERKITSFDLLCGWSSIVIHLAQFFGQLFSQVVDAGS